MKERGRKYTCHACSTKNQLEPERGSTEAVTLCPSDEDRDEQQTDKVQNSSGLFLQSTRCEGKVKISSICAWSLVVRSWTSSSGSEKKSTLGTKLNSMDHMTWMDENLHRRQFSLCFLESS